ncbi:hypothetical protein LINPERHAP1_LOCUS13154 [Linum perenne]
MKVEAEKCINGWECDGADRCKDDCKNKFNGRGSCDSPGTPYVPYQCTCIYDC